MPADQDLAHCILCGLDLRLARDAHGHVHRVQASEQHARDDREGQEDPVVQVLVSKLAATGLDADHLELVAPDADGSADRVLTGEESRRGNEAEHDHITAESDVVFRNRSASCDALVEDLGVGRRHADEPRVGAEPAGRDDQALDILMRCGEADHRELRNLGHVPRRDRAVGRRLARADADVLAVDSDDVGAKPPDAR